MLMGTVDRDTSLLIGATTMITFPKSGKLSCFADDLWLMYFNNRGSVMLTVDLERNPVKLGDGLRL
jgi:hypothetical protein